VSRTPVLGRGTPVEIRPRGNRGPAPAVLPNGGHGVILKHSSGVVCVDCGADGIHWLQPRRLTPARELA